MSRVNRSLSVCALAVACAVAFGAVPVHAGEDGRDGDHRERDSRRIKKVFVIAMENHNWTSRVHLSIVALALGMVGWARLRIAVAIQAKPHSSDRLNRHAAAFQLAAKMGHVDVDEIRPWVEVVAESIIQDILARHDLAAAPQQKLEERPLARGQPNRETVHVGVVLSGAQDDLATRERRPARPRCSTSQGRQAGTDLRAREGLDDVVISPGFERAHYVIETGARGRHQDRRPHAELSCPSYQIDAVHVGQAHIHDHGIQIVTLETSQRSGAGPNDIYPKSRSLERCFQSGREQRIILNHGDQHLGCNLARGSRYRWICKPEHSRWGLHDHLMIAELYSASRTFSIERMSARGWILVVDDHIAMAENIAEMLELDGYQASIAGSAAEALAAFSEQINALITDFRMTDGNGAQLIAEIRRRGSRIPAVVMTAYADDAMENACTTAGALAVLPKPVEMGRLLALVSEVVVSGTA